MSAQIKIKPSARYYKTGPFSEQAVTQAVVSFMSDDPKVSRRGFKVARKATSKYLFVDISAADKHGNMWRIEAKGKSTQPRGDFLEGLGQILTTVDVTHGSPRAEYYLALPELNAYRNQARKLSMAVRKLIGLGFLFVDARRHVKRYTPGRLV